MDTCSGGVAMAVYVIKIYTACGNGCECPGEMRHDFVCCSCCCCCCTSALPASAEAQTDNWPNPITMSLWDITFAHCQEK